MNQPDALTLRLLSSRIAELCRFTDFQSVCGGFVLLATPPDGWLNLRGADRSCPDFAWDLNAASLAEQFLLTTDRLMEMYTDNLTSQNADDAAYHRQNPDSHIGYIELPATDTFELIHAPAWLRCIALDRTLSPVPIV